MSKRDRVLNAGEVIVRLRERYEYRVIWQRKNRLPVDVLRQTERGARDKVAHLLWFETPGGRDYFADANEGDAVEPLSFVRIERRLVGTWEEMLNPRLPATPCVKHPTSRVPSCPDCLAEHPQARVSVSAHSQTGRAS